MFRLIKWLWDWRRRRSRGRMWARAVELTPEIHELGRGFEAIYRAAERTPFMEAVVEQVVQEQGGLPESESESDKAPLISDRDKDFDPDILGKKMDSS